MRDEVSRPDDSGQGAFLVVELEHERGGIRHEDTHEPRPDDRHAQKSPNGLVRADHIGETLAHTFQSLLPHARSDLPSSFRRVSEGDDFVEDSLDLDR